MHPKDMAPHAGDSEALSGGGGGAGGGGKDWDSSEPNPMADAIREVTVQPLMTGFIQGFASVAIPYWKARRKARREARAAAEALPPVVPDASSGISDESGASVYIGPQ